MIRQYETAIGDMALRRLVIDREGMAAGFLATLAAEGRAVVTILRTEQYRMLASFTEVGSLARARKHLERLAASSGPGYESWLWEMPVENSEVANRREAIERCLSNIQRWAPKARERKQRAIRLAERLRQETKAYGDALYRRINGCICEHDRGDEREWRLQHKPVVKAMQAEADADLAERWRHYERVRDRQDWEATRYTRYCLEQCDLLRALEELETRERAMYELANG